jgi:hypothetical protein
MSTVSSPRPRFACRVVRLWSSLGESEPVAHVASCADCRRFFAASAALEANLRARAARCVPTPAGLERSILHAVRTSEADAAAAAAPRRAWPRWLPAGAAATAVLAVVVIVSLPRERPVEMPPQAAPAHVTAVTVTPDEMVQLLASAAAAGNHWWQTTLPSATIALEQNALQQELASVYADARSALDFLALNFLPKTAESTASAGPPSRGI